MSLEKQREEATKEVAEKFGADPTKVHVCMADDMHPYNCDGMFGGSCIHCERKVEEGHDPETCALCNFFDDEEDAGERGLI